MRRRDRKKQVKWAQMTDEERANMKLREAERDAPDSGLSRWGKDRKNFTKCEARMQNLYRQRLGHWANLHRANKSKSAAS